MHAVSSLLGALKVREVECFVFTRVCLESTNVEDAVRKRVVVHCVEGSVSEQA